MSDDERKMTVIAVANIGGMGAALWLCGSFDWTPFGWLADPVLAKVGKVIFVLSMPVNAWHLALLIFKPSASQSPPDHTTS
jgi:hypothetical protein